MSGKRYAFPLWALFALFVLRVAAQLSIALGDGRFLPPWEEWFSGALSYPWLLASQIAIIVMYGKAAADISRGRGWFAVPRGWVGSFLVAFGSLYFGVMVVRYVIRMTLYPPERWTGGSIPVFFHWVLAAFLLVMGAYHRRFAPATAPHHVRRRVLTIGVWLLAGVGVAAWVAYQLAPTLLAAALGARRAEYAVRIERSVRMTTSDGVDLVSDIYHPVRAGAAPTILVRIPFSKTMASRLMATIVGRYWAERGYTVVVQGTRGRYKSGGRYQPLVNERRDGLETLAWLKTQRWFDGRLGMWGGSAFGHTQWAIADAAPAPPAGRSAFAVQICSTDFHRMFYPGGAFSLASALFWAVRSRGTDDDAPADAVLERGYNGFPLIEADDRAVQDIPFFDDWVNHKDKDDYWRAIDGDDRAATLQGPVLLAAGWFDPFLPGQLDDFVRIRRSARGDVAAATRLVIGPWEHASLAALPDAPAQRNYRLESLAPSIPWFDRHLRSMGDDRPPVRIFVMGANVWRDEQEWPLARARATAWYLESGGHANSVSGDGRLTLDASAGAGAPDVFRSDPQDPVPSRGGAVLGPGGGVARQTDVEARRDVLVYTSTALDQPVEVTGPVTAILYVAASTPTADFTVKLVDVYPDGRAFNVTDGILRRAYAAAADPASAEATEIEISLWPTSVVFGAGHRIRVDVAASNFPRFDRNTNTDAPIATATRTAVAMQAVHHGRAAASRIVLPVVINR